MNKDELLALAVRVEALEGPDREVDAEIAIAVDGGEIVWLQANGTMDMYPARQYVSAMHVRGFGRAPIPTYTASIDAAMSLIKGSQEYPDHKTFVLDCATQTTVHAQPVAHVWNEQGKHTGKGRTPALALTAACLRAIAGQEG